MSGHYCRICQRPMFRQPHRKYCNECSPSIHDLGCPHEGPKERPYKCVWCGDTVEWKRGGVPILTKKAERLKHCKYCGGYCHGICKICNV